MQKMFFFCANYSALTYRKIYIRCGEAFQFLKDDSQEDILL